MKLTKEEKKELWASFKDMKPVEKVDYLYTYFKLPIFMAVVFVVVLISGLHHQLTKKEPVVYLGLVNVAIGEELEQALTVDFVDFVGENPKKTQVQPYYGLYLSEDAATENHEYAYASRMKILAAINAKQLDVVLMNKEAYDIFSGSGYLLALEENASSDHSSSESSSSDGNSFSIDERLKAFLVENDVILSDNTIDYQLNEADELIIETKQEKNALEVSGAHLLKDAGFPEEVYVGIVANSPRLEASFRYLDYLVFGE